MCNPDTPGLSATETCCCVAAHLGNMHDPSRLAESENDHPNCWVYDTRAISHSVPETISYHSRNYCATM